MVVVATLRGQGLAGRLMAELEAIAREPAYRGDSADRRSAARGRRPLPAPATARSQSMSLMSMRSRSRCASRRCSAKVDWSRGRLKGPADGLPLNYPFVMEILRYAAFSGDPSGGNPAGIVLDATDLDDAAMQQIAADIGYSETAFLIPTGPDDGAACGTSRRSPRSRSAATPPSRRRWPGPNGSVPDRYPGLGGRARSRSARRNGTGRHRRRPWSACRRSVTEMIRPRSRRRCWPRCGCSPDDLDPATADQGVVLRESPPDRRGPLAVLDALDHDQMRWPR